jgi:hypothetical protein
MSTPLLRVDDDQRTEIVLLIIRNAFKLINKRVVLVDAYNYKANRKHLSIFISARRIGMGQRGFSPSLKRYFYV